MNYQKIYDRIIENAKKQKRSKNLNYYENHHIIPRALEGPNNKENTVFLTAREHFVCHWLLYKLTSGVNKSKMAHAWFSMCRSSDGQKRKKISSKKYEYAKRAHATAVSKKFKNRKLSNYELIMRKHKPPRARKIVFDDICFTCVRDAAHYFNVNPSIIRKVESGELPYQYLFDLNLRKGRKAANISASLKGKNKGKTYEEMYGVETAKKLKDVRRKSRVGYKHKKETLEKLSNSKKGKEPWNKNKRLSEKTKKKMSKARMGKSNNRLKYTVLTPLNKSIYIDENIGLRKWLKDNYNQAISSAIKTSLKTGAPVKRGKWKGYIFYAEPKSG